MLFLFKGIEGYTIQEINEEFMCINLIASVYGDRRTKYDCGEVYNVLVDFPHIIFCLRREVMYDAFYYVEQESLRGENLDDLKDKLVGYDKDVFYVTEYVNNHGPGIYNISFCKLENTMLADTLFPVLRNKIIDNILDVL